MKQRRLQWKIIPDEGGQALTEFVIVIPIMLLFFFAMIQYFSIVQASQLGNYAAFVAARVYAVNESFDSTNAPDEATKAASIVLAPIARPALNEIGGDTTFGNDISSVMSSLNSINGGKLLADARTFGEGYAMAKYARFNSDILGGSVSCSLEAYNGGTVTQVVVNINYPQPIYVPGLTGLWKMLGGQNIYASLNPQAAGLTGIPKYLLPVYAGNSTLQSDVAQLSQYDSGLASSVQNFISGLPVVLLPYIDVQSECSIGYSAWSGTVKLPDTIDDTSETNNDSPVGQESQLFSQAQSDQTQYTNACNTASSACTTMTQDYSSLQAAQAAYNSNPSSQNKTNLDAAQKAYDSSVSANTTAQNNVTTWENAVNNDYDQIQQITGQQMQQVGGVDCKCCPPF
jgi:Flp pilus assembly protein TadG